MRIYPRKGKLRTVWYIDFTNEKGQRVRKAIGTKKEAQLVLADIRLKLFRQEYDSLPAQTKDSNLNQFVQRYFDHCAKTHAVNTISRDRPRLRPLLEFLKARNITSLKAIEPGVIQEFQSQYLEDHSPKTWNNLLGVLKSMLNRAVEWGVLDYNPVARVKPMKVKRKIHFFSEAEVARIIEEAPDSIKPAIIILVSTGMRRSELFHLRWKDVDLRNRRIYIRPTDAFSPKGGRPRSIPISDRLYATLTELRQGRGGTKSSGYVCRPYDDENSLLRAYVRLLRKIGLKGSLHTLRHTFASHLAMAGTPIPVIKELLGHADITTTMIYAHLSPEIHKREIAKLPF